jgi:hypothetical protein
MHRRGLVTQHPVTPAELLDRRLTVPEHVVRRSFETQTLLLNLETGRYHGLNKTGGRLLELIEGGSGDVREAVHSLAREFGVPIAEIEGEVAAFCADLADKGLIEIEGRSQ